MDLHAPTEVSRDDEPPSSSDSPATADSAPTPPTPPTPPTQRARAALRLDPVVSDRETLAQARRAFERGEEDSALENLSRLTAHGVQFADVHYMLGVLQERRDELDAALESLRRAIRINPSYVEALLALASLHERRGDFDRSRGYAERAVQLSRSSAGELDSTSRGKLANQQAALADALSQAGEKRDAIEEYRRALDRCPTFHDIRHRLAVTLRESGLPFQAAQELRRILRLQPSMLVSQVQLGLTYYSMGQTPEAIAEWEEVLEKDPGSDEARMYLRLVRGATRRSAHALAPPVSSAEHTGPEGFELDISGWATTELSSRTGEPGERSE